MIENRTPTITRKEYEELSDRLFRSKLPGGGQDDQEYSEDTLHAAWRQTQDSPIKVLYELFRSAGLYMEENGKKLPRAGNKKCSRSFFDWDPKDMSFKLRTGKVDKIGTNLRQFNSDSTMTIRVTEGWNFHFLALDDVTDTPIRERTYNFTQGENNPHKEFQETVAFEIYAALKDMYGQETLDRARIQNPMNFHEQPADDLVNSR